VRSQLSFTWLLVGLLVRHSDAQPSWSIQFGAQALVTYLRLPTKAPAPKWTRLTDSITSGWPPAIQAPHIASSEICFPGALA